MDQPKKQQPTAAPSRAAAAPKKSTSTLLDAFEVDCIRRELESLLLKQNAGEGTASSSSDAAAEILGLSRRRRHSSKKTISSKNARPVPPPPPPPPPPPAKKLSGGRTRLHLGKHAMKLCSGALAVSSAAENSRRPRRAGYREVEKV
ncbi:hypothetical protein CFC21_102077 [Triticum aestivum]|uniref:Uncharacterized protein n=2 Tax=Triticum aestivum TaxID=4565 RepID=A0A9R1M4I9_WHEAT|nr:hypothetical protein CFC21_102077 [Triticum aestivum]